MTLANLVYPDQNALARLLKELTEFFAQFPSVNRIFILGSMARGNWDRWSDIDLLIVTQAGFEQQWQIFDSLRQFKPILHHHPFISVEPSGGFVPGIVFEKESVFHILDLNFMTFTEFQSPQALDRFGPIRNLFAAEGNVLERPEDILTPGGNICQLARRYIEIADFLLSRKAIP
jgi:predicted nucleotidyltransferase